MAKANSKNDKNNEQALIALQQLWHDDAKEIKKTTVEKLGLDANQKIITIGNFKLHGFMFRSNFDFLIIDNKKDLNNKPNLDNKKAEKYLQTIWKQEKKVIHSKELKEFDINTRLGEICIGNFTLTQSFLSNSYDIQLKDKEKGIFNKISDENVNIKKIILELKNFVIQFKDVLNEKTFEDYLLIHFKSKFENVDNQVSIGGTKALKIDLDIGNGKVGIELKLANKVINNTERQRLIGQIYDYTTKRYTKNNLIVIVAGEPKLRENSSLKEIEDIIVKQYKSYFYFIDFD